jgi:glycerophosphoryl diester phosphodiesterase
VDYRNGTVATDYGRAIDEHVTYLHAGAHGVFTDNVDIGVVARDEAFQAAGAPAA